MLVERAGRSTSYAGGTRSLSACVLYIYALYIYPHTAIALAICMCPHTALYLAR
jgi:hypothetical protein